MEFAWNFHGRTRRLACHVYVAPHTLDTGWVMDFDARGLPHRAFAVECRKSGNAIQVKVNVNAKAQFEEGYWRGILDAQGKTDGGYY